MRLNASLKSKYANGRHNRYQPRGAKRSWAGIFSTSSPGIALPRLRDAASSFEGSSKLHVASTIARASRAGCSDLKIPEPTNTDSAPSCRQSAASAGVAKDGDGRQASGSSGDLRRVAPSTNTGRVPIRLPSLVRYFSGFWRPGRFSVRLRRTAPPHGPRPRPTGS